MLLDLILPKKFASNMVKWTMLRKNTPNMMRYNFIIYIPFQKRKKSWKRVFLCFFHFFRKESFQVFFIIKSFFFKFWKVVKLVQEALKEPEHTGSYDEYIELCKLYDKNENGTMMLAELENFLSNLGKCFTFNIPCIWRTSDIPKLILGVIL